MERTLIQRFGTPLRVTLWICAVLFSLWTSGFVAFKIVEHTMMIVAAEKYPYYVDHAPVLLKRCDGTNRFTVGAFGKYYGTQCSSKEQDGTSPAPILVTDIKTDIKDDEVAKANRDLYALVFDDGGTWQYLSVVSRGPDYTDVQLVQPTTRDAWQTTWYRMQNGTVHAQKVGNYKPQFALLIMPIAALLAVPLILGYGRFERYVRKKYSVRFSPAPATNLPLPG